MMAVLYKKVCPDLIVHPAEEVVYISGLIWVTEV
jgi:hypothetical protein